MRRKMMIVMVIIACIFSVGVSGSDYSYLRATFLNQDPDPASPGDYVDLRWKIEKFGNQEASDVAFMLDLNYPFRFDRTDTAIRSIGNWAGYSGAEEYYTLRYKVLVDDDGREGRYPVKLSVSSKGGIGSGVLGEFDVWVAKKETPKLVLGGLWSDPIKLVPDIDEAKLEVEIENIGEGDARTVVAELLLPEGIVPSYSFSDRVNLGTIAADAGATAQFYVDISGDLRGEQDVVIRLTYKESGTDDLLTIDLPLSIPLKDAPSFRIVEMSTQPPEIAPGSAVKIRLVVENIGGKKAESVSVRAFKDSSQPFDFSEKTDYIGTLEPGHSGEAVIALDVDKDAVRKKYQFDIEIRTIFESSVLVEQQAIEIVIDGENERRTSPFIGFFVVAGITAVGVVAYFAFRKKR